MTTYGLTLLTIIKQNQFMSIKDFQVVCKIGDGTFSTVYKVKRIIDGRAYALKQVKLEDLSTKEIHNAINEVRFMASIRHPNIVCYKQAFYDSNSRSLCIVMEYADGGDLLQKIFEMKRNGDQFPEDYVWDIFIQIVKGLNALHQLNITHRDIKSANIFLAEQGIAKLADFNVSTVLNKGKMCETQTGTPYYASPQIWKDQPYDAKSDIWSLGCVLFELIHLKPPFRARDMDGLSKKVNHGYFGKVSRYYSSQFTDILELMLNPDPFQRTTCKDLLQHPIIKDKMKKAKEIINLQSSALLKTIKPVKNMNYLTERLPKPNYEPLRFKSLRHVSGSQILQKKMMKGGSEMLPRLQKSLNLSQATESLSLQKMKRNSSVLDPELPSIVTKRKRY